MKRLVFFTTALEFFFAALELLFVTLLNFRNPTDDPFQSQ